MNILINASNLKLGGGIQVADSICGELNRFPMHNFIIVLSSFLDKTAERIKEFAHITVVRYNITNSLSTLIWGRDKYLDKLVIDNKVDCVLTVFGPSRWNPKVSHISGFAMSHLVLPDSPYFSRMKLKAKLLSSLKNNLLDYYFRRSTKFFFTENSYISNLLQKKWPKYTINTITNYYNQIFDTPEKWENHKLPKFDGFTILCVSANYPHKNLEISIPITYYLKEKYPDFKFRFIFTINANELPIPNNIKENFCCIGKVDISECPSLYKQAQIAFQPTLLECFTATYPEAMKMEVPIVTTDLEFARGLCERAAVYYSPLSVHCAAESIYKVATESNLRKMLIEAGKQQLNKFDTSYERANKLIGLCENIINHNK